ncbi:MAG: pantoate--beta-alanine ligase [Candidatus Hydrogenedentes bacterium]|nr:pantoate--beta-alanine ligase [Candidatus Hydrogenedentota bacterium]
MILLETADAMRAWSRARRAEGRTIGFAPTMGALHEGHASLARAAVRECGAAVASIFVNPTQFAPNEDFDRYPRTFEADRAMLEGIGVHALYLPSARDMYPESYSTYVEVGGVSEGLCGGSRPHFFRGVATVVTKLFNAVEPDRAYFGQKDAQQCAVIRRMARDLDTGVEIVQMPIVREADGLAMSSRNRYLGPEERARALCISRSLFEAERRMRGGLRDAAAVVAGVGAGLAETRIDYVELVDAETMRPVAAVDRPVLLAAAAWVGDTRLIDNILFTPDAPKEDAPCC